MKNPTITKFKNKLNRDKRTHVKLEVLEDVPIDQDGFVHYTRRFGGQLFQLYGLVHTVAKPLTESTPPTPTPEPQPPVEPPVTPVDPTPPVDPQPPVEPPIDPPTEPVEPTNPDLEEPPDEDFIMDILENDDCIIRSLDYNGQLRNFHELYNHPPWASVGMYIEAYDFNLSDQGTNFEEYSYTMYFKKSDLPFTFIVEKQGNYHLAEETPFFRPNKYCPPGLRIHYDFLMDSLDSDHFLVFVNAY